MNGTSSSLDSEHETRCPSPSFRSIGGQPDPMLQESMTLQPCMWQCYFMTPRFRACCCRGQCHILVALAWTNEYLCTRDLPQPGRMMHYAYRQPFRSTCMEADAGCLGLSLLQRLENERSHQPGRHMHCYLTSKPHHKWRPLGRTPWRGASVYMCVPVAFMYACVPATLPGLTHCVGTILTSLAFLMLEPQSSGWLCLRSRRLPAISERHPPWLPSSRQVRHFTATGATAVGSCCLDLPCACVRGCLRFQGFLSMTACTHALIRGPCWLRDVRESDITRPSNPSSERFVDTGSRETETRCDVCF